MSLWQVTIADWLPVGYTYSHPMMKRRSFFSTAATASVGAVLASKPFCARAAADEKPSAKRVKLGIASYSYWHFRDPKVSIETVIEKAADLGVAGVDVLHRQMDIPEKEPLTPAHRAYLRKLKR